MTYKDRQAIIELYYLHRYKKTKLAQLYGLSRQRISYIIATTKDSFFSSDEDCYICDGDEAIEYFIDKNTDNHDPQNKIRLCRMDLERIVHLQIRRIKSLP